jgi:hypothetical protein
VPLDARQDALIGDLDYVAGLVAIEGLAFRSGLIRAGSSEFDNHYHTI